MICDFHFFLTKIITFHQSRIGFHALFFFEKIKFVRIQKKSSKILIINTAQPDAFRRLDFDDMAKTVAHRTWRGKNSKFWASDRYLMSFV